MAHDAGDEHIHAVGDDVHLQLDAAHILVHQHGVFDAPGEDLLHIDCDIFLVVGDDHVLPADDVAGAQQHRISQILSGVQGFGQGVDAHALGTADVEFLQQGVKPLPILGHVDGILAGAQDLHALAV